jgi:peptidoglycan-associated lipoprotein
MANMQFRLVAGVCPLVFTLVTGCHHAVAPPVSPVAYDAYPAVVAAPSAPAAPPPATAVRVSADILTACRIDDSPTGEAPLFAFDSAALSRDDQRLLGEVARCLTRGPLAGRALTLVGRADPRGTEAYNARLGDLRATGVESYLERHGVAAAKLRETSRGALDATGHDESGWRMDRRVDVDLAM